MPNYLTIDALKQRLHFDGDEDDTVMTGLLDAAEAYIGDPDNGILRRPVVVEAFTETFNSLSDVRLRFPDGATVTSVTYTDFDGAEQALGAVYSLIGDALVLLAGEVWPQHKSPVTVIYTAGFVTIPEPIISAGYFYAGTLYEGQANASMMKPEMLRQLMCQMLAGYRRSTL
ncbi:MAG: head-tail connector protein [Sulfitobacter sp.]